MEVDSIATQMATKSTHVAHDTNEATTETMHPSTLFTIVKTEEGIENFQPGDGTRVAPMVE
jgi:hypothetical protein